LGVPLLGSFLAYDSGAGSPDPAGLRSVRARKAEYVSALTALHGDKDAVEDVLAQVRSMLGAKAVREETVDRYVDVARTRIEKVAEALAHPETTDLNSHEFLKTLWWVDELIASLALARNARDAAPLMAASTSKGSGPVGVSQGEPAPGGGVASSASSSAQGSALLVAGEEGATLVGDAPSPSGGSATLCFGGEWGGVTPCDSGGGNTPPVAENDNGVFAVKHDTRLEQPPLGVKWNDWDAETPTEDLTVRTVTWPSHAAYFDLQPEGSFVYEPQPLWAGLDYFTYELSDGEYTDEATAEVWVYNDPPVPADDSWLDGLPYMTDAVTKLVVAAEYGLVANDSEPDGDSFWISDHTDPAHGTLTNLNVYTGAFEYQPDGTFAGEDTFQYWLTDGVIDDCTGQTTHGGPATVTLMIVPKLDLDVKGLDETQEDSDGGLVVENADNNNAPRKEIILQQVVPTTWTGYVALRRESSGGEVRVFDSATGGTEITFNEIDNVFTSNELPKHLYVEGCSESAHMRDVVLTLRTAEEWDTPDSVKFTVLWVDPVDVAFQGNVAQDNEAREVYRAHTVADHYLLGSQEFQSPDLWGWGTEARGIVHPNEFEWQITNVFLDRNAEWKLWDGSGTLVDSKPYGTDRSDPSWRDDDPTNSDPFGAIYDLDTPGTQIAVASAGTIARYRGNFEAFATLPWSDPPPDFVRASAIRQYYVRFSIKQVDAPTGNNWVVINDVAGDNSAGYGTTSLAWNLQ